MIKIRHFSQDRLLISFFPIIALLLFALILNTYLHLFTSNKSVIYTYAKNFLQGEIGPGYGPAKSQPISSIDLEPGDIILGGWKNCAYGEYSHAGLYIGDNNVLEAYVDYGITVQPLKHYLDYNNLCILRVKAPLAVKENAITYAQQQKEKLFYPLSFKSGDRFWNCTKLIWKAYYVNGIELDAINDIWIAPESFRNSTSVLTLFERRNN